MMSKRTEAAVALFIVGAACLAALRVGIVREREARPACIRTDLSDLPPEALYVAPRELSETTRI